MDIRKIKFSTLVCLIFVLFSGAYLLESFNYTYWLNYTPGAGFMPRWVGALMMGISIICLVQSFRGDGITVSEVLPKGSGRINLFIVWAVMIFFILFAKVLGFVVTSTAVLAALFSRGYKWPKAIFLGVLVSVICYVLFKVLLGVPIPTNKLGF